MERPDGFQGVFRPCQGLVGAVNPPQGIGDHGGEVADRLDRNVAFRERLKKMRSNGLGGLPRYIAYEMTMQIK